MSRLTGIEVEGYRRDGYHRFTEQVFAKDRMDRLGEIFEEHVSAAGTRRTDELDTPHIEDDRLLEFLLAEEVADLVEPLIGPDIGLFSSHFIAKEPRTGRPTPWHEDSAFWQSRFSDFSRIVTVWLALDDVDRENGCMAVIPGTHDNGFSAYRTLADGDSYTFEKEIAGVDESSAVYLELKRGQASLHDSRIIHGAKANTSPRRRAGYTMRYFDTSARVLRQEFPVWLVRGVDKDGGNGFVNG
ncbi:phytanoyl-CoA dioxygenase family protein [Streptomyces sp. NPDC102451]|uniref:phytanoyl-CoA dioxygenase family protein n=1 Tax=Streptomyces sp. NPDC102451 TaxID=3366177 RepID=UPI003826AE1A